VWWVQKTQDFAPVRDAAKKVMELIGSYYESGENAESKIRNPGKTWKQVLPGFFYAHFSN